VNTEAKAGATSELAAKKETINQPSKAPSLLSRLRTWLRKGHTVPFTRFRVLLDVMRDPEP